MVKPRRRKPSQVPVAAPAERQLLRPNEAAWELGCSARHVYRLMASGALPSVQSGTLRRVSRRAVDDYVAAHEITRSTVANHG
jgi:excisionase family DNA binding protein